MIGLDTNVLIRYIVQDDRAQARAATRLIESRCGSENPGFVSLVVLVELAWVLEMAYAYAYARAEVRGVLAKLLTSAELRVEAPDLARAALQAYTTGPADFADYLIGHLHASCGCETTYTFDKRTAKSGLHALLV